MNYRPVSISYSRANSYITIDYDSEPYSSNFPDTPSYSQPAMNRFQVIIYKSFISRLFINRTAKLQFSSLPRKKIGGHIINDVPSLTNQQSKLTFNSLTIYGQESSPSPQRVSHLSKYHICLSGTLYWSVP